MSFTEVLRKSESLIISLGIVITSSIMFAARRLIARPLLRVATRQIHATSPRFAAAGPPNLPEMMMNDPKIRETFEKLSRHPPAIAAMQKVGDIIKGKGMLEMYSWRCMGSL